MKLQRSRLKTKDPEKFGFRPKELLSKILTIYINLEEDKRPEFVEAVVKDSRSFKVELFEETLRIVKGGMIVPVEVAAAFERLVEKVKEVAQSNMEVSPQLCMWLQAIERERESVSQPVSQSTPCPVRPNPLLIHSHRLKRRSVTSPMSSVTPSTAT